MSESRLSSLKLISWNQTHYSQTSLIRTPKGQSEVSKLGRCLYYRGFFLKDNIGEFWLGHWKLSVILRCPYQEVRLQFSSPREKEKSICGVFMSPIKCPLTEGILCGFYAVMSKKCTKKVCCMCRLLVLPRSSIKFNVLLF